MSVKWSCGRTKVVGVPSGELGEEESDDLRGYPKRRGVHRDIVIKG